MAYLLSRSILFFLENIRVFGCIRPEWQGSEVCLCNAEVSRIPPLSFPEDCYHPTLPLCVNGFLA